MGSGLYYRACYSSNRWREHPFSVPKAYAITRARQQQQSREAPFSSLICPPAGLRCRFPDPAFPDKSSILCEPQFRISLSSVKAEAVNDDYFWFSCPSEQLSRAAAPLTDCAADSFPSLLKYPRILGYYSLSPSPFCFPRQKVFH